MANKKIYKIDGMHCGGCAKRITEALSAQKEIKKVSVRLETKEAEIIFNGEENDSLIKDTIERLGFSLI